jgi:hypothetical protein
MAGDSNMYTALEWSKQFIGPASLSPDIANDRVKLLQILDVVKDCIGQESDIDKADFKEKHGRTATANEDLASTVVWMYDDIKGDVCANADWAKHP